MPTILTWEHHNECLLKRSFIPSYLIILLASAWPLCIALKICSSETFKRQILSFISFLPTLCWCFINLGKHIPPWVCMLNLQTMQSSFYGHISSICNGIGSRFLHLCRGFTITGSLFTRAFLQALQFFNKIANSLSIPRRKFKWYQQRWIMLRIIHTLSIYKSFNLSLLKLSVTSKLQITLISS